MDRRMEHRRHQHARRDAARRTRHPERALTIRTRPPLADGIRRPAGILQAEQRHTHGRVLRPVLPPRLTAHPAHSLLAPAHYCGGFFYARKETSVATSKLPASWSNKNKIEWLERGAYEALSRALNRAVADTGTNFSVWSAGRSKAEQVALFKKNYAP